MRIDWVTIERKWRKRWQDEGRFEANVGDGAAPKKFITVAYPYPNSPQHVGHGRTYTIADVHARFSRMRGYNVLFPMGFHYTGTPILGMAKRVEEGDSALLDGLHNIYCVPQEAIDTFTEPVKIADYFHNEIKAGMIEMGYSIDWRREFTTIDPAYQRFIEWHVKLLQDRGLIVQGSHPVGWCPRDQNPVSQHDTVGDVEPEFTEYTVVKFRWKGRIVPTATLRPETIFGVTNLWVNPTVTYVEAVVDGERWIVSEECARKLEFLGREISYVARISGADLVGGEVELPYRSGTVPMLDASFVDANTGTGLVMSVPAHAPFDYRALADFESKASRSDGRLQIAPIQVIATEGYGQIPAKDAVETHEVADQSDPRLEEVSAELYEREFYGGTLLETAGEFAGRKVSEAKNSIKAWLTGSGYADAMLELSKEVRCRCGAKCVVKIFSNQWFLNYADTAWKKRGTECLEDMEVLPSEIRSEFHNVIGWLRERACARQRGMGTRLPWDKDWIVESLADSVIYMAYYIVARFVGEGKLDGASLPSEFFDYVLLGRRSASGIPDVDPDVAEEARAEFTYFYPVDSRHSGRDLVPNHLTFFVLNHVATFPRKHWPRQIVVNGSVLMDGKKMSKSMGNIIPLRQAIHKYGADPIRLTIIVSAELLQDAEFNFESVASITHKLEVMMEECARLGASRLAEVNTRLLWHAEERWILSRLQGLISGVTSSMERMRFREALDGILFSFESDVSWYLRRADARDVGHASRQDTSGMDAVLHRIYTARVAMLSPFAPHAAEEMWEMLGNAGIASGSKWPEVVPEAVDERAVMAEHYLRSVMDDIASILRVTGIKPKVITVYTAGALKRRAYAVVLKCIMAGRTAMGNVMKEIIADPETAGIKSDPVFVQKSIKDVLSQPEDVRQIRLKNVGMDEREVLISELSSLALKEFGAAVTVHAEDDTDIYDPNGRARLTRPFKPALLVE